MVDTSVINELFQKVHDFYPMGSDRVDQTFPGKVKYDAILKDKIDSIINHQSTAWESFASDLSCLNEHSLFNMSYLQFPCFIGKLQIVSDENSRFNMQRTLVIAVSLLCDYYTLYFEDTYAFAGYTDLSVKPKLHILFSKRNDSGEEEVLFNTVHSMLRKSFPRFGFVNHKLLFDTRIKGGFVYPDGEACPDRRMNLFNFLFDGDYLYKEQHLSVYE